MILWDHVIRGYILYSLFIHVFYQDSPTGRKTIVVVFTSLLPDLIDKPLAWQFGVFPGGYALGHSVFLAVPLSLAITIDPSYIGSGDFPIHRLLWPIGGSGRHQDGFIEGFAVNFIPHARSLGGQLLSGDPGPYVLAVLGLGGFGSLLWVYG